MGGTKGPRPRGWIRDDRGEVRARGGPTHPGIPDPQGDRAEDPRCAGWPIELARVHQAGCRWLEHGRTGSVARGTGGASLPGGPGAVLRGGPKWKQRAGYAGCGSAEPSRSGVVVRGRLSSARSASQPTYRVGRSDRGTTGTFRFAPCARDRLGLLVDLGPPGSTARGDPRFSNPPSPRTLVDHMGGAWCLLVGGGNGSAQGIRCRNQGRVATSPGADFLSTGAPHRGRIRSHGGRQPEPVLDALLAVARGRSARPGGRCVCRLRPA